MSGDDSTSRLLRQIQNSSAQLLRSCSKVGEVLPANPGLALGSEGGDWPQLLAHFKNVSAQLVQLGNNPELAQLEHVVPVPLNPAALPDGRPTMRVPQLLQTKLSPEQEAELARIEDQVKAFLPNESLPKEEREKEASTRANQMRHAINMYNRELDQVLKSFWENPARKSLKRKCAETVNRFHTKKASTRAIEGTDLLILLHTGQRKPSLVELSTVKSQPQA